MIAKFDRNEKHIANDLVKLLIHCHVVTKLFSDWLILRPLEVSCLTCVENLAKNVLRLTFTLEANWFTKTSRDNLTEELVFYSIVQEDGTSLHIK